MSWLGGGSCRLLCLIAVRQYCILVGLQMGFSSGSLTHSHLSTAVPAGPGRGIISEGFRALARGAPDMNSLVGLGATASFAVSAVAALLPKLGERVLSGALH